MRGPVNFDRANMDPGVEMPLLAISQWTMHRRINIRFMAQMCLAVKQVYVGEAQTKDCWCLLNSMN